MNWSEAFKYLDQRFDTDAGLQYWLGARGTKDIERWRSGTEPSPAVQQKIIRAANSLKNAPLKALDALDFCGAALQHFEKEARRPELRDEAVRCRRMVDHYIEDLNPTTP